MPSPSPDRAFVQKSFCTTREAAHILGISLRTAQLWVESGLLDAWKTTGGHRRISRQSVDRLLANPRSKHGAHTGESNGTALTLPSRPFTILVMEDVASLRYLYEIALARWPITPRVVTVADGCSGLVHLGLDRPDMLISNLHMPDVDGLHMIRVIAAMPELAQTAVVVVTGLDSQDIQAAGGLPEGITVLPKPIPFQRLRKIAETHCATQAAILANPDKFYQR